MESLGDRRAEKEGVGGSEGGGGMGVRKTKSKKVPKISSIICLLTKTLI